MRSLPLARRPRPSRARRSRSASSVDDRRRRSCRRRRRCQAAGDAVLDRLGIARRVASRRPAGPAPSPPARPAAAPRTREGRTSRSASASRSATSSRAPSSRTVPASPSRGDRARDRVSSGPSPASSTIASGCAARIAGSASSSSAWPFCSAKRADHQQHGRVADAPFAAQRLARPRRARRARRRCGSSRSAPGRSPAARWLSPTASDTQISRSTRRSRVAMLVALVGVGQQIGQVLGADHRHARGARGADGGVPLPADAGMDVDQVGPARARASARDRARRPGRSP